MRWLAALYALLIYGFIFLPVAVLLGMTPPYQSVEERALPEEARLLRGLLRSRRITRPMRGRTAPKAQMAF